MRLQAMEPHEVESSGIFRQWGLKDSEFDLIKDTLKRLPNYTEAGIFSVMWSEHCSYKNSKPVLRNFFTEGKQVIQGPGEGAGIVDIGDNQAVVFKMESHNHPSAVEPYEGAATGVGGIIRDIFSMGARPIAMLDSLRFGELTSAATREIVKGVVAGIGGYGNSIGIPTVGGETKFDAAYEGNPLVNAMGVGLINHEDIQQGRASGIGNSIMYAGAKTGRDGIHGATFSSDVFSEENSSQGSPVQVGDPFMEKLLMEACLDVIKELGDNLIGIQDMGAAGVVSSSSEMASKANTGIELNLDLVPQREVNMTPYEILLSESQERMLLCVKKGHEKEVEAIFKRYALEAVTVGKVVEGEQYRVYQQGELVVDVPVHALAEDAPVYYNEATKPQRMTDYENQAPFIPVVTDVKETLFDLLTTADLASKEPLYSTFDSTIRTSTVVGPGSDAAVVRIRGTKKALALTADCNARYIYLNPFVGGQIAVAEAARNVIASGGYPLAITDCLNFGNPENPEIFYELQESAKGISTVCEKFNAPVISGNVSLYNENVNGAVYPTPTIGMVGLIEDVNQHLTQSFKAVDDLIYLIGETGDDFSGSLIQKVQQTEISGLVQFDIEAEYQNQQFVRQANEAGLLTSAHDLSEGGLGAALMESTFNTSFGFDVTATVTNAQLFSETQSRFIVSVKPDQQAAFEQFIQDFTSSVPVALLGQVTEKGAIQLKTQEAVATFNLSDIEKQWKEAIPCLLNQ